MPLRALRCVDGVQVICKNDEVTVHVSDISRIYISYIFENSYIWLHLSRDVIERVMLVSNVYISWLLEHKPSVPLISERDLGYLAHGLRDLLSPLATIVVTLFTYRISAIHLFKIHDSIRTIAMSGFAATGILTEYNLVLGHVVVVITHHE